MHGMYGTQDAELEVQRTIKRAELTAFLCFLREASGPTVVHVDKSRLASVCAPRVVSWCLREFLLSRLRAHRGTHARKFRVCVEKGWGSPPPFPLTLTDSTHRQPGPELTNTLSKDSSDLPWRG